MSLLSYARDAHADSPLPPGLNNPVKPDLQADGLRRYAARTGVKIVAEYIDGAVSGRQEGRPGPRC